MDEYQAILITPARREIKMVTMTRGPERLDRLYSAIECDTITGAYPFRNGDVCFVDDEGLLKPWFHAFWIPPYPNPLVGNGVVTGSDDEGESVTPKTDIQWLKDNVVFIERLTSDRWGWYAPGKPDEIVNTDAMLERTGAQ